MAKARNRRKNHVQVLRKEKGVYVGRVRVYRRGKNFHLYWSENGRVRRKTTGTDDPEQAVQIARAVDTALDQERPAQTLHKLAQGVGPQRAKIVKHVMAALEGARKASGCKESYLRWLRWRRQAAEAVIGERAIRDVTPRDCERILERGASEAGQLRYLRLLFSYARSHGWLDESPAEHIKVRQTRRVPVPFEGLTRRAQYLTRDQVAEYERAFAGTILEGAFLLGLYAGLRKGEILNLRWSNVREDALTVTAGDDWTPKSGKARTIPLHQRLKDWLDRNRKSEGLVCPAPGGGRWHQGNFRRKSDAILDEAGLTHVGWHVLRHTFGVEAASKGVPLSTIQNWLGLSDVSTTAIYSHWAPDYQDTGMMQRLDYGA